MPAINILAVLVAALSTFVLGGIWYGPLFRQAWCHEAGIVPDTPDGHPAKVFGGAFVLSLIAAGVFAMCVGSNPQPRFAVLAGLVTGLAFVATSFGINYLFAGRSLTLWLIDGGYHVLQFTLYGVVLGFWPF